MTSCENQQYSVSSVFLPSLTVNPLLSPLGRIFISSSFGGLFNRDGGSYLRGGLFNLEKTIVTVLHKELEYKVKKLKYKKVGGRAAEDQNQIQTSSW